jgi:quinoprotein glucose dehydrogenase
VLVGCIPDLAALQVRDGNLRARTLHSGFGVHIGVTGHDLHGLVVGPDRRLYFTIGDRGAVLTTREGQRIDLPDTGAAFRCELDGSKLEVIATGLRNPQELAFDGFGNLITVDNDTAGTDPCRVLHLVDGGDYGWRFSYQHMPDFGPWQSETIWRGVDDVLPSAGHVAQGPAGLAWVPGPSVSEELVDSFLICDFPGGVRSFRLRPSGASYQAEDTGKLVWGLWPTDVAIGADSAIYVSDWVNGWQRPERGRIYKLADPAPGGAAAQRSALRALLTSDLGQRRDEELIELLDHEDLRAREAAHFALSERPTARPLLQAALGQAAPPRARLHALWALAIVGRSATDVAPLCLPLLEDSAPELRALAARSLGDVQVGADVAVAVDAALARALLDPAPRVRLHAALALARRPAPAQRALWDMLARDGDDPFLRHAAVVGLRPDALLREVPDALTGGAPAQRFGVLLALRRGADPRVAQFVGDPDPALAAAAIRAIHDVPIPAAYGALTAALERELARAGTAAPLAEPLLRRLLNVCLKVGDAAAAELLSQFAARDGAPAPRVFALDALATFAAPDAVDPVLGLWRPVASPNGATRSAVPAEAALSRQLATLLAAADEVAIAALRTVERLALRTAAPSAAAVAGDVRRAGRVRAAACRTLAALGDDSWRAAVADALAGTDSELRLAVLELLGAQTGPLDVPAAQLSALAREARTTAERQAALRLLPRVGGDALVAWLNEARTGKLAPELAIDLRIAATASGDAAVTSALAAWPARDEELFVGGDVARGRTVFRDRAELQCLRCHGVAGEGGTVGPALDQVGRQSAADLLQALRDPNAKLAAGWPAGMPSAMPAGLDRLLTHAELRDLLAYLQSLR